MIRSEEIILIERSLESEQAGGGAGTREADHGEERSGWRSPLAQTCQRASLASSEEPRAWAMPPLLATSWTTKTAPKDSALRNPKREEAEAVNSAMEAASLPWRPTVRR